MSFISIDDCIGLTGEEETLEQAYIREERKIQVHHVLRKLKPEYQQILWLIYFENQSYAAAITKDGIKQYALDSFFLEVRCNEKCLVAPAIKSFDVINFNSGKLTTIDG